MLIRTMQVATFAAMVGALILMFFSIQQERHELFLIQTGCLGVLIGLFCFQHVIASRFH